MDDTLIAVLEALGGVVVGGVVSYLIQRQQNQKELEVLRETQKTEFSAEETVRRFLKQETNAEQSFPSLQKHLGGFADDELRQLLVRAGAIRVYHEDGSEWWRLLTTT